MKVVELRGKSTDELTSTLLDLKKEAFNLRFQKVSGELENTARIREVRRTIARIKTLANSGEAPVEAAPKAKKKAVTTKKPAEKKAAKKSVEKKTTKKTTKKAS